MSEKKEKPEKKDIPVKTGKFDIEKIKHTGAVAVPSMFTLSNMGCGFFSVLSASEGDYVRASWLIVFSYFMDLLDGRIARFLHGESPLGIELDSFADWMSFGIAPAYMIFRMTLKDLGYMGYAIAFFYVLCGLLRLARFNLKAHFGESDHHNFQGLPIPGAAGIIIAIVLNYSLVEGMSEGVWATMMTWVFSSSAVIVSMLALLMVSSVPFPAFKGGMSMSSRLALVILTVVLVLFIGYPRETLFIVFSGYVLYGVICGLVNMFKNLFKKEQQV